MRIATKSFGAMKRSLGLPVLAAALAASACSDINTPDYNRPGVPDLEENPNATLVNAATVGMVVSSRLDAVNYIRYLGIMGREAYYLDQNESRYVSELVTGGLNSSSFAGGGLWTNRYGTVRQGYVVVAALDKLQPGQLSDAQKQGVAGFTKTFQAIDLAAVAHTRAEAPIDVNISPLDPPAPLVPRAQVYARAKQLLDEGATHLRNAGSSFSFSLPSGFTQYGMNTPAGMLRANRALRARLDVVTGDYTHAAMLLNAADSTFINTTSGDRANLNRGIYYSYSAGSGDITNGLQNPAPQVADTILRRDAQLKVGGARDDRFTLKTASFAGRSQLGIFSDLRFTHYNSAPFFGAGGSAAPVPVIRNEELILLRAEARWFAGDPVGAYTDLNFVRTNSGGLAPIAVPATTNAEFIDHLLYERRYSLMYEGGWRWIDLRRFNLLDNPAYRVKDYPRTGDRAPTAMPIPFGECIARGGGASSC